MPLSSLNKVISLLVTGLVAIVPLSLIMWRLLAHRNTDLTSIAGAIGPVTIGFLIVAVATFIGAMFDGIAELFVRRIVHHARDGGCVAGFFFQRRYYEQLDDWQRVIKSQVERGFFSNEVKLLSSQKTGFRPKGEGYGTRQLAVGLFLKEASREHMDYIISHHATYHLTTNLVAVTPVIGAAAAVWFIPNAASWAHGMVYLTVSILVCIVIIYFLMLLAVEKFLYTYSATFRFAALCIDEKLKNHSSGSTAAGPAS